MFGKQHRSIHEWLTKDWWTDGPPIAVVQGFPGTGKTEIGVAARDTLAKPGSGIATALVDCPDTISSSPDDLLLILAERLSAAGDEGVANDLGNGKAAAAIASTLLATPRLVVIDEAERLIVPLTGNVVAGMSGMLQGLAQAPNPTGRLLLLSSRQFEESRELARARRFTLDPFDTEDAASFLRDQLDQRNCREAVTETRIPDVVNWLGRNARALRLLAASLASDSLEDLIGLAPEAWEARDRTVSPELLRKFEREVLSRAEAQMDDQTQLFLRRIAILRRSFKRQALEALAEGGIDWEKCRDELTARYILELRSGWYTTHPVLRETLLARVAPAQQKMAHLIAGRYYAAAFRAKSIAERPEALGARFIEARYHFTMGESEQDLAEIAQKFEHHLTRQFGFTSRIPTEPQELDERITLLSALLQARGAKGLEFHLAKCLLARNKAGDVRLALPHIRRATGPQSPYDAWLLRIRIENELFGYQEAIRVARQGIAIIPPTRGVESLYYSAAEILAANGKSEEAVTLLREGIACVPPTHNLASLYHCAAEILAASGKPDEAIPLLREGIAAVMPAHNNSVLYHSAAELLAANGKASQGIHLLREAIRLVPVHQNLFWMYSTAAVIFDTAKRTAAADAIMQVGCARLPQFENHMRNYRAQRALARQENAAAHASTEERLSVLSVATEWTSRHGGLSTFNRQLCAALAGCGLDVTCLVAEANFSERANAASKGVTLIEADRSPGVANESRLFLRPSGLPIDFKPDYIIGHGRITGPAAKAQGDVFPLAKRLHFVHMAPDEIEWLKPDRADDAATRAEQRTQVELDLARTAYRAIAVGPRLFSRLARDMSGYAGAASPLEFVPGFDLGDLEPRRPPPGGPTKVLLMCRAGDESLKGLDIAAAALGSVAAERGERVPEVELFIRGAAPGSGQNLQAHLAAKAGGVKVVVRNYVADTETLEADLRSASLVLMPSRAEGFGLIGLEALVAGTPILISRESGLGALLASALDSEAAARIVVDMAGDDQTVTRRWATAVSGRLADPKATFAATDEARRILAAKYSWRSEVERLLAGLAG